MAKSTKQVTPEAPKPLTEIAIQHVDEKNPENNITIFARRWPNERHGSYWTWTDGKQTSDQFEYFINLLLDLQRALTEKIFPKQASISIAKDVSAMKMAIQQAEISVMKSMRDYADKFYLHTGDKILIPETAQPIEQSPSTTEASAMPMAPSSSAAASLTFRPATQKPVTIKQATPLPFAFTPATPKKED